MSQNGEEQNEKNDGGTGTLEDAQESVIGGLIGNQAEEENANGEEENVNEDAEEDRQSHRSSQPSKQSQRTQQSRKSQQSQSRQSQQSRSRQSQQSQSRHSMQSHQTSMSRQSYKTPSSKIHEPIGENSSKRSATRSRQSTSNKKGGYDLDQVTALSKQIYQGQPITTDDPDLIAAAILDLQDMRYQFECDKKFDEALQVVQAIDRAREVQKALMKKMYSNEEVEEVNQKIQNTQRQLERLNKKAESQTSRLNYELGELVENLRKRQQAEIDRHDQIWTSEAKIRDYNRTSGKVRALRYQQQKMLNSKRYAEAEQVRRIADKTVVVEAQAAHEQMQNEYKESLDLLLKKHQEEMDNLLIANSLRKAKLQHKIEQTRAPLILRISQLENEEKLARNEDRVWNHRYKLDSATISKRMGMTADANVQSARLKIPKYNTMKLPPLEINPLKEKVINRRTSRI